MIQSPQGTWKNKDHTVTFQNDAVVVYKCGCKESKLESTEYYFYPCDQHKEHPEYGKDCPECGGYEHNHRSGCAAVE